MSISTIKLFAYLYLFRLLNALLCRTFFQPDEFYQSLEIAHHQVFGYGFVSWEWRNAFDQSSGGIRSPLYPFLFVPPYALLKYLRLDQTFLLILVPKLIQAAIAAVTDLAIYRLSARVTSHHYASAALSCSLTSFFNAYAGIRTFSNSAESALTAVALSLWPWTGDQVAQSWTHLTISLCLAAISVIIRPSAVIFWALLGFQLLRHSHGETKMDVIALVSVVGCISAFACFVLDSCFYRLPTFTPLNFIRQNVYNSLSSFYGLNRWHFYFTQAFTFVNLSLFPTVIIGMMSLSVAKVGLENELVLLRLRSARFACLGTMLVLSVLPHKEFRFIQPLIPLFCVFAGRAMVNNYIEFRSLHPTPTQPSWLERTIQARPIGFIVRSVIAFGAALYLLTFQYRGQMAVVDYLRGVPETELQSVGLLAPCHSTPWQSHLHRAHLASEARNGSLLWMLSCEPPIHGQNLAIYKDQSDSFYEDPIKFLVDHFPSAVNDRFPGSIVNESSFQWPSHIVLFSNLLDVTSNQTSQGKARVGSFLQDLGYITDKEFENGRWHDDRRREGKVIVMRWNPAESDKAAR
ncbi:family 22 glycosyltransferase [Melampsora larici-populina 98AG31]|uniref:Mannosyltransferase n=1 Tax=Melampsora larici-populina (strain 98AG31 / pathotype 3-4-7) TaxID=747676 RepID=F4S9V3_MELLP|nr:family 22 glycosyltransferase [Melampsora larici-populina 98AG31]EGF98582.1 family 22 glycosyltransferase [Melampsora larici-populina 98AG31]